MEIQEQDPQHLRYDRRDYTSQEAEHLIADYTAFQESRGYKFFLQDLHVEVADLLEELEDTELTTKQIDILRGKIIQTKQLIFRIKNIQDFLEATEKDKNQENDE